MPASGQYPAGPELRISSEYGEDAVVVRLEGELDLATAAPVRDALEHALSGDCPRLVVDLRGLAFLDSAGIHVIVQTHQLCLAAERSLSLLLVPGHVQRVLEVSGMLRLLDHTTEEILAA